MPEQFALPILSDDVFSVSDLNQHIKHLLERDPILSDIGVAGEISNFKAHSSGHCYFSLKDSAAQIRCAIWRSSVARLRFRPADGDRVVAFGNVDMYTARGELTFIVRELRFAGQGALFEAFERLKALLHAEGLFAEERKRPLPDMPRRIGVITSPTGAVIRDIINVLGRRYPMATLVLIPAAVQGFTAPIDLLRALAWAEAHGDLDVVIMARGGGSAEDLWCFNDEELVRAVADFSIPLISAIGHETDFTLLDFVADRRAPTPSAAAELVAPDLRELLAHTRRLRARAAQLAASDIRHSRQRLDYLRASRALTSPGERIAALRSHTQQLRFRLQAAGGHRVKIERQKLEAARAGLRALDPRRVLERGYAMVADAESGALITALAQSVPGQKLSVTFQDGTIRAVIEP